MASAPTQVTFGEHKKLQLVTEGGIFNGDLQNFLDRNGLNKQSGKLFIVSIIGMHSSGKSTLLNHLVHTNLRLQRCAVP